MADGDRHQYLTPSGICGLRIEANLLSSVHYELLLVALFAHAVAPPQYRAQAIERLGVR